MAEIVPVSIEGKTIYIEMEASYGSELTSPGAVDQVRKAFDRARETVTTVTGSMVKAVRAMDDALTPDEFELEFSIKFKVDGTVVIASIAQEATLGVKMVYRHKDEV